MRLFITAVLIFSTLSAQAQIVFAPAASYLKIEDEDASGSLSETELSSYDFKLGYLHESGLYLGGMYTILGVNDNDGYSAGPTVGFNHYSGFFALFTYHLVGEMDNGPGLTMTDGMGPQVDLGWVFPLTSSFHIGPQITYRSINYQKAETSTGSADIDYTRSNILPYITMWFKF